MKQMSDWQGIFRQGAHQGIARLRKVQREVLDTVELAGQVHCLSKALAGQNRKDLSGLIIHTYRGVQYTCEYANYLNRREMTHSMAQYVWQNACCERVNRTIKNNYLACYAVDSYRSLCSGVARAVRLYNRSKPHRGLPSRLSPDQFVKNSIRAATLIIVSTFGRGGIGGSGMIFKPVPLSVSSLVAFKPIIEPGTTLSQRTYNVGDRFTAQMPVNSLFSFFVFVHPVFE